MNENHMTPEGRLRASDPFAGAPYAHPASAAMLARVSARERVAKVTFAQGFRLRMGSAALAAALVTTGGIAAMQAAVPSLSVFALGASHSKALGATAAPSTTPSGSFMRIFANYQFVAGPDLSSNAGSAPTYAVSAPSDLTSASISIASALGVSGAPSPDPTANGSWTITDSSSNQVNFYTDGGTLNWYYSSASQNISSTGSVGSSGSGSTAPSPLVPPTTTPPPASADMSVFSNDSALAAAQGYLSQLGISGDFGTPQFSTYTDPTSATSQTSVDLPWQPFGVYAGYDFSFTFDGQGNLLYANGVDASVTQVGSYPIISEVAGVAALQTQQDSYRGGPVLYSPVTSTTAPTSSGSPSTTPDTTPSTTPDTTPTSTPDTTPSTTPDTTPVPPTVTITLDAASITYSQYTLADGSTVLLPQYSYSGTDANGNTVTWPVILAVDPSYVNLSANSGVHPLMY